jgi:hypothetical protein
MGTTTFIPVTEGEEASAANINSRFSSMADVGTGLNALDLTSIEREALRPEHLPNLSAVDIFSNGYAAIAPDTSAVGTVLDNYDNRLPLSAGDTAYPYTYQTFHANAAVTNPYGPPTISPDIGWAIVAYQGVVANAAEVTLVSATNLTTAGIKGILLRGAIELRSTQKVGFGHGVSSLAIGIGFQDGVGARHVIERSVRFYSGLACELGDCVTSTILTQDDADVGDGTITSMFVVVSGAAPDSGLTKTTCNLDIGYYNLSAVPLHAGDL